MPELYLGFLISLLFSVLLIFFHPDKSIRMSNTPMEIECPECGSSVSLTQAITSELGEQFKKDYQTKIKELQTDFSKKEKSLQDQKDLIANQKLELKEAQNTIAQTISEKLEKEKISLRKKVFEEAKNEVSTQVKDLKNQVEENQKKLMRAQEQELIFRKKQRELEEKEKNFDLELQRKLDQNLNASKTQWEQDQQQQLKLLVQERDLKEESLRKKIEELNQKLVQGSQQSQGEVLELILESELQSVFPQDDIVPVPKGVNGADVLQNVKNKRGDLCGTIIWESKRTKAWNDGWIQKLKDDQRTVKADIALIVSQTLPKNIKGFALIEGVWVCDVHSYTNLASALRLNLLQLQTLKQANVGKNDKMEAIYQYLSGNEFKQRVLSIVEAFQTMNQDLDKERIMMQKHWAKRQKEIDRVVGGTVGMYGDLEGIIGNTLPRIEGLDLPALSE